MGRFNFQFRKPRKMKNKDLCHHTSVLVCVIVKRWSGLKFCKKCHGWGGGDEVRLWFVLKVPRLQNFRRLSIKSILNVSNLKKIGPSLLPKTRHIYHCLFLGPLLVGVPHLWLRNPLNIFIYKNSLLPIYTWLLGYILREQNIGLMFQFAFHFSQMRW